MNNESIKFLTHEEHSQKHTFNNTCGGSMTEQDAIKKLNVYSSTNGSGQCTSEEHEEAKRIAIKALEEVQQLRKEMWELNQICRDYTSLGTVEELKEAKEKPKAKKPRGNDLCTCPNCDTYNEVIKKRRNTVEHDIVYCWNCGQTLEIS